MIRVSLFILLLIILVPACRLTEEVTHTGEVLTYSQYEGIKLEDNLSSDLIRSQYGAPEHVHEENGRVRRMIYRCQDSTGKFRDLELLFDEREILREKHL
jgi:hypothetical protein